jgi:hypothetical protein
VEVEVESQAASLAKQVAFEVPTSFAPCNPIEKLPCLRLPNCLLRLSECSICKASLTTSHPLPHHSSNQALRPHVCNKERKEEMTYLMPPRAPRPIAAGGWYNCRFAAAEWPVDFLNEPPLDSLSRLLLL